MKKSIRNFCLITILSSAPIFIFIGIYIYLDPFRIIHTYEPYFSNKNPMYVGWNKGYISTDNFNRHYKTMNYDSFIFGSSRSIYFLAKDWKPYLPNNASVYHFDASAESLSGILQKIKYIKSKGLQLQNVLIVLDTELLFRNSSLTGHLFAQHPDITTENDIYQFHKQFFDLFCKFNFVKAYIDLHINGIQPYMTEKNIFNLNSPSYDSKTNEESYPAIDSLIKTSPQLYYNNERLALFPNAKYEKIEKMALQIGNETYSLIAEISTLLKKSNVKVVIVPKTTLSKINPKDLVNLKTLFGEDNVFDFSGDNAIARDYTSFYDHASHARPEICKILIDSIYSNQRGLQK